MNKLWGMPQSTIARRALWECWTVHLDGCQDNWCAKLHNFLDTCGIHATAHLPEDNRIPLYNESEVVDALQSRCHRVYTELVAQDTAPHDHDSKLLRYHLTFADCIVADGPEWPRARYLDLPLARDKVKLIARFRLSNHYLRIETGRWQNSEPLPVAMRTCTLCGNNCIQDELHWVFACPALQGVRVCFPRLFGQGGFTQLRKLFGLHIPADGRVPVAKDICGFLGRVGGIYSPPGALAAPNDDADDALPDQA